MLRTPRRGTRRSNISGTALGIAVCAVLLIGTLVATVVAFRRSLPGGQYEGTMGGAFSRGALLGLFIAAAGFLLTLLLVLIARAAR
jgi:hypothetical protein